MASNGWSARLYWQWILYNTIAFVAVLTAVAVLSWIGWGVLAGRCWHARRRAASAPTNQAGTRAEPTRQP